MIKSKILVALALVIVVGSMTSGCGKKKIFEKEGDQYKQVALTDSELNEDVYYTKDGAYFYATYLPEGNRNSQKIAQPDEMEVLWTDDKTDNNLIPTMYQNEVLAYRSAKITSMSDIHLERYKDLGNSFGVYGGQFNDDGYYEFSVKENTLPNTSINSALQNSSSDQIRIVSINDKPINSFTLAGGVICGLKEGKNYTLNIYDGTDYTSITATPDKHFYQSYEVHYLPNASNTKKNYLQIEMTSDLKSGFYKINGCGLFRYYNFKKGEKDDAEINMNDAYDLDDFGDKADTQQYVASIETQSTDVLFSIQYETNLYRDEDVTCILTSPNGTDYEMECLDGLATINIATAMAGRWTMSVYPKELEVIDVKAESSALNSDTIKDSYDFNIKRGKKNMKFFVKYIGEGEIWGTVEDEEGNSVNLVPDEDKHKKRLYAKYSYLKKGHYTVHVYHYPDVAIEKCDVISAKEDETVDEIIVED